MCNKRSPNRSTEGCLISIVCYLPKGVLLFWGRLLFYPGSDFFLCVRVDIWAEWGLGWGMQNVSKTWLLYKVQFFLFEQHSCTKNWIFLAKFAHTIFFAYTTFSPEEGLLFEFWLFSPME
jgi:hypothetical protein